MKRIILIAILLIATQQYAAAQLNTTPHDTVYGRKDHIYSVHWYDTCQEFLSDTVCKLHLHHYCLGDSPHNTILTKHYTPHRLAVKGLACMVMRPEEMEILRRRGSITWSLSDQNLPQYLLLYKQADTGLVLIETTERYDTIAPTLMEIPIIASGDTLTFCHLYEAYFKAPVYVDSEFFVTSTNYGNGAVYIPEYGDLVHQYRQIWHVTITHLPRYWDPECTYPWSTWFCCHFYNPPTFGEFYDQKEWGPFFPIVDFYNVTTESANPAMGSTSGDGRFSDLTDVVITATPEPGYLFSHWNDSVTDNPRTVFVTQDTAFTAYFRPAPPSATPQVTAPTTRATRLSSKPFRSTSDTASHTGMTATPSTRAPSSSCRTPPSPPTSPHPRASPPPTPNSQFSILNSQLPPTPPAAA